MEFVDMISPVRNAKDFSMLEPLKFLITNFQDLKKVLESGLGFHPKGASLKESP